MAKVQVKEKCRIIKRNYDGQKRPRYSVGANKQTNRHTRKINEANNMREKSRNFESVISFCDSNRFQLVSRRLSHTIQNKSFELASQI